MSTLAAELDAALDRASRAAVLLVVSDFDGVLADFTDDPEDARPRPGALAALRGLAAQPATVVAVASGRDLPTLRRVTGFGSAEPVTLIGSHGAEASRPGLAGPGSLDRSQRDRLDELTAQVAALLEQHPGARLERKRAAVALHTRGLADADAADALAAAAALGDGHTGVRLLRGKSVVELSVSPADKGTAVAALAQAVGSDVTVYCGDDVTDEDAFRRLDETSGDVAVKVGPGATAAAYRVASVTDAVALLQRLHDLRELATAEAAHRR